MRSSPGGTFLPGGQRLPTPVDWAPCSSGGPKGDVPWHGRIESIAPDALAEVRSSAESGWDGSQPGRGHLPRGLAPKRTRAASAFHSRNFSELSRAESRISSSRSTSQRASDSRSQRGFGSDPKRYATRRHSRFWRRGARGLGRIFEPTSIHSLPPRSRRISILNSSESSCTASSPIEEGPKCSTVKPRREISRLRWRRTQSMRGSRGNTKQSLPDQPVVGFETAVQLAGLNLPGEKMN